MDSSRLAALELPAVQIVRDGYFTDEFLPFDDWWIKAGLDDIRNSLASLYEGHCHSTSIAEGQRVRKLAWDAMHALDRLKHGVHSSAPYPDYVK